MHRDLFWSGPIGPQSPYGPNRCNLMFARKRYREHNAYVKLKCPKEKLLIYNFKDGWKPLCDFTGVEKIPEGPIPRENSGGKIVFDTLEKHEGVVREKEIFTRNLVIFTAVLVAILGYIGKAVYWYSFS